MRTLGQLLITHRQLKNVCQRYMADELNISQTTYHRWETGYHFPDIEDAMKLAELLAYDFAELCRVICHSKKQIPQKGKEMGGGKVKNDKYWVMS